MIGEIMELKKEESPATNGAFKDSYEDKSNNRTGRKQEVSFADINAAALSALPALLVRWLPDGVQRGQEYIARNPRRADRQAGSFSINMRTGKWADFASGDTGGDVISLAAYLSVKTQSQAARELARMLGLQHDR